MNQQVSSNSPLPRFSRLLLCVDSSIASIHAATYVCQLGPDGQLKLPHLWSRKFPHPVKQD